uniref:Uncharacterized protein n=1 Tax=Ictidomys tridecemlineatus TaxID=43179 RepID=A0A287D453_ICTTR
MVPAACVLFWALLLSLGLQAAGAQDQTPTTTPTGTGTKGVTLSFGSPARSRNTGGISQSSVAHRTKIVLEDENDAVATADRLAGPAAAELLATVTGMSRSSETGFGDDDDGSLEEGVVIDARKNNTSTTTTTMAPIQTRRLTLPPPPPSPGLVFWKKVRMGLEDIWNSLSSVFTEMQPTHRNRR